MHILRITGVTKRAQGGRVVVAGLRWVSKEEGIVGKIMVAVWYMQPPVTLISTGVLDLRKMKGEAPGIHLRERANW
jgi:hypothetical protein